VKLTKRGKEFLGATVAGTIVATVIDVTIVLALCLSLVFAALVCEIILTSSSVRNLKIKPEFSHLNCFKGEVVACNLVIPSNRRRLVSISLAKLEPPRGIETEILTTDQNEIRLQFRPRFAGRFSGLSAKYELNDPLQLFSRTNEFTDSSFYVDCYPSSILKEVVSTPPLSVSLGELQGASQGAGSEFYAVDEYRGMTEKKNIFWKKVASMPDERLLVKMRVANIQKSISIGLINTSERGEGYFEWIDSMCEGVGYVGKAALQIGCDVEMKFDDGTQIVSVRATDLGELSEAIMEMSASRVSNFDNASLLLSQSDIYVTGFKELQDELVASAVARKPALLIEDPGVTPVKLSNLSIIYSPYENLGALVNRVAGI
jgi:hypothetical protein